MSKINVDTWEPESGTAATLMATGDTVTVPSGASLVVASGATINITGATQTGFPSAGFIGYTVYTGNATWLKSANSPTKVVVEVVGGGGGSGSGATGWAFGGGGGSGGYVRKYIDVTLLTSATIVIGAGGIKDAGTSAGNSSWTDNLGTNTLTGGLGGNGVNGSGGPTHGAGGAGGTAAGGDINILGENGLVGNAHNPAFLASSGLSTGGYGFTRTANSYGASTTGHNYGGGAAQGRGDNATNAGSDGAAGVVIMWEYA